MMHNQKPMIVCGDLNFPLVDWFAHQSPIEEQSDALGVLKQLNLTQRYNKETQGSKILDVIFFNMFLKPELATDFE